jgi:NCS1 family nucleobase:cation symporter-1
MSESDAQHLQHDDGRVELREDAEKALESSPIYNHDLAPTRVAQRTWTTYTFAALWISMAHCIPTYKLAAGLVDPKVGMNWWQAILTISSAPHVLV